jgi:hypothetical protein
MKQKNLLRIATLFVFAMISVTTLKAQTLSAGDIAIIGVSVDDEEVLLVALSGIPSGESVFFTDDEWGGSSFNSGEGFYEWITPAISAGTTFTLTKTSTTAGGTITQKAGSMTFSNSGDGFYLYQTSTNIYNTGTYTVLGFAGEDSGDAGTLTGTGLVIGTNAIYFGGDNGIYNGTRVGNDKAGYLALIYDNANWATSGSSQTFDTTDFVLSTDPLISFDAETSSVNETDVDEITSGIPVTLTNYDTSVTITPTVNGSSTADPADYTIDLTPLTFSADETLSIPLTIHDDIDFIDETIIIDFTVTTGTADLGTSQHTVTITDDELAPSIGFDTATSDVDETNATFNVLIPVTVANYSSEQIDISIAASGTADGTDYTLNTASLSFSADGSQNVSLDINDDADTDSETVILTITETSSITGLVISQSTHTVTITDDEVPPAPTAGTVFITEVSEGNSTNTEFIEIYNNSNESVSMSTSKIVMFGSTVYDFIPTDIGTSSIPARGFLIITRGGDQTTFEAEHGALNANTAFIEGSSGMYFGAGTARRWQLWVGGTENTADGTLIDDTDAEVGGDGKRHYQNIFTGDFILDSDHTTATPGALEYLVYSGGAWVNSVAMDGTTVSKDAYFYDDFTLASNSSINNIGISSGHLLTINDGTSLLVADTSSGNVTYNRNLTYDADKTKAWYLVSSPVNGEIMTDMISNNTFATSGANIGFAPYDNSQADANNRWAYFGNTAVDALVNGKGYTAKLGAAGTLSFTGTLNTGDIAIGLTQGSNNFNLIGNPYASFIDNGTFLTANTDELEHEEVYIWNQATIQYDTKVSGVPFKIAPGQGFFVEAKTTNDITFTTALQSNEAPDTFQKSTARPEVQLFMDNGDASRYLKVYYIDGTTTGFDNGYDGKLFGGVPQPFALYTHLVSDSEGENFQIQSLPNSDYENMVIPVGITAEADKEITFTAEALNLPSELKVFLEDRQTNSYTRLDEANANYKVTLTEALNGIGRFYLHTAAKSTLNIDAISIESISVYKTTNTNLRVVGVSQGKATVKLFNILGKQVLNTTFTSNGVQDISLPNLATGIYIVQLETEAGKLNKKITLE